MSNLKTNIIKTFKEKFVKYYPATANGANDVQDAEYLLEATPEEIESFFETVISQVEKETREGAFTEIRNYCISLTGRSIKKSAVSDVIEFIQKILTQRIVPM
jgi:Glu-tRNA(Gln) amidotransferase subunit E-like FAD-binding protein